MSVHTPGPWSNMPEGSIIPLKSVDCERFGFQIGFVNTDKKAIEREAKANASLISAAPELLEACIALQAEAQSRGCGLRIADEAIAKATGE